MNKTPFYRQFYEQAGSWSENVDSEERIPATLAMIPKNINSILDVGCGDGTFLGSVDSIPFKVGLDISFTALSYVKMLQKIQASSDAIPFKKNTFDCIMSTEVLEHLPPDVYENTLHEIQRVARRYILISVPFLEDLAQKQTRCSQCGFIFHIFLHLRSFDISKLEKIFPSYSLEEYQFSGPKERTFPPWLLKIRRKYGRRWEWDKDAMCPKCGHKSEQPPKRSVISVFTTLLAGLAKKRHPKWVSVLYEKK